MCKLCREHKNTKSYPNDARTRRHVSKSDDVSKVKFRNIYLNKTNSIFSVQIQFNEYSVYLAYSSNKPWLPKQPKARG